MKGELSSTCSFLADFNVHKTEWRFSCTCYHLLFLKTIFCGHPWKERKIVMVRSGFASKNFKINKTTSVWNPLNDES